MTAHATIVAAEGREEDGRLPSAPGCQPTASAVPASQSGIPDADDFDDSVNECANCGGEGFTYGCSWDWQCDTYDEGEGTCLCTRRCEWCNPLTPAEIAERDKLRDILATALAKDKIAGMRGEA